eukprot:scaffold44091_cov52-Phaeocystis_antarctica.AAC.2
MAFISGEYELPSCASSDAPASRSALTISTFCPIMASSSGHSLIMRPFFDRLLWRPFGPSPRSTVRPDQPYLSRRASIDGDGACRTIRKAVARAEGRRAGDPRARRQPHTPTRRQEQRRADERQEQEHEARGVVAVAFAQGARAVVAAVIS